MAPSTGSHSSGSQRRTSSAHASQHRRSDGRSDSQRCHRRAASDEAQAHGSYEAPYYKGKGYTASPNEEEHGKGRERSPSVYMQQEAAGDMEGLSQFSDTFDPIGLDVPKALMEETTVNPLHQRQSVVSPVQPSSALGSDAASQGTPVSLAKLHPSLPDRPMELPPLNLLTTKASSLRATPLSTSDNDATVRLTRNLWDTRREMTALQARETELIASLRRLNAPRHILESEQAQKSSELEVRLAEVENELQRERYKRLQAERGLSEIERENRAPFVVPALFRAFIKISEMNG